MEISMTKINDMLENAPQEIKESDNVIENRYSFEDVKCVLRDFVGAHKQLGYFIYFDFPNLFRIGKGTRTRIAGEFSPTYVKISIPSLLDSLLSYPSTSRYKSYFLGKVRLIKVE